MKMRRRHLLAAPVLPLLAACDRRRMAGDAAEATAAAAGPPTLNLFTWADYVKPELVQQFEHEQKCKVVIDTFDSNEAMLAKLKSGATGYDLVVPSSYMV